MTTVPTLQLGFTIQSKETSINPDAIQNVLAMTGKGTTIRWMEAASRYFPALALSFWGDLDTTIAACNKAGLPVCLPIHNLDKSMTTPGTGNCKGKDLILPAEAAKIATALVTRYKGKRVWYEELNEGATDGDPDCDLAYAADPNGLVALMSAIYSAIKAVDPTVHVGGPALLKIDRGIPWIEQWLTNVFVNGGGKVMNSMALHYYPGMNTTLPTLAEIWQCFQAVAQKHGHPHLKLKITEYGIGRGHVTPQQQNDFALAVIKECKNSGGFIDAAFYYTAAENDGYSPYGKDKTTGKQVNYPLYTSFQGVR